MKIAINLLSTVPNQIGGVETFLVNLVQSLLKTDVENEFLLLVCENNKSIFNFEVNNSKQITCNVDNNSRVKRVLYEQIVLPFILKQHNIDLLIAPGNTGLIFRNCKILVIVYDLISFVIPEIFPLTKRLYIHNFVKYSCKNADKILTSSANTKKDIVKYTGVDENKIDIIYGGVDNKKFCGHSKESALNFLSEKYGISGQYIYSPTSFYKHKNNDILLKAFAELKKTKAIKHKLIITGFDPYNEFGKFQQLAEDYNVADDVFFLKVIPFEHIPFLYSGADLTVYLSRYEGFGLPLLEAMASKCPVLSSNQSCLPEVIGDAGLLVNPYNTNEIVEKMFELLNNENLRKEYIEKGLSRVQEFTWENVARRLIQTYRKMQ